MKKYIYIWSLLISCSLNFISFPSFAQITVLWDKTIGGGWEDRLFSSAPTSDGGYLLAGWSNSLASEDKSEEKKGVRDYWIVKIDSSGNKIWDKTLGGSESDWLSSISPTLDDGFLLAGISDSPASGDKSEDNKGIIDYWVVKIDGNGNKVWDKTFGGSGTDQLTSTTITPDGGYLLAGDSNSPASGDKSVDNYGSTDYWVVKIDGNGNKIWDKTIGGGSRDYLFSTVATPDGGYLLGGYSNSPASGDKSEDRMSYFGSSPDYWVVKIDGSGNKVWDRTFGGSYTDVLRSTVATPDGGYLLAGNSILAPLGTPVLGNKSAENKGPMDYWVVKIDGNGNKVWERTFGGSGRDHFRVSATTPDGGFLLGGNSYSPASGDKSEDSKGYPDYWVIKIDGSGNKVWDKTIGGISSNNLESITVTDEGYLLAGWSTSPASGDKSEDGKGRGGADYWVVKIQEGIVDNESPVIEEITPITSTTDAGTCTASVPFSATVTDNSGVSLTPVFSILQDGVSTEITSPHTFPIGETIVYVNATDADGNEADEQTFTVTVEDKGAPVIEPVTPITATTDTGSVTASVAFAATVTDNCDASVSPVFSILLDGVSTEINSPHNFSEGETLVYVNATDAAGNEASEQSFLVTIGDTSTPTVEFELAIQTTGAGTVSTEPEENRYPNDAEVLLTASPDPGWAFDRWEGDLTGSTNPITLTMEADRSVTAVFIPQSFTLTSEIQGNGNLEIDPMADEYPFGTEVSLKAVPATGWLFHRWEGDISGNTNPASIIMDRKQSVTAVFTEIEYSLTIDIQGEGQVNRIPEGIGYTHGTVVELTTDPESGWIFGHWEGDVVGNEPSAMVLMDENKVVSAIFVRPLEAEMSIVHTTCANTSDGSITIVPSGGTAPYSIDWGAAGNADSRTIVNLSSGTYPITDTDANGLTLSLEGEVLDSDTSIPVPDLSELPLISEKVMVSALTPPTATHACEGSIVGTTDVELPITASTTITWTYTDSSGNSVNQDQDVIIEAEEVTLYPNPVMENSFWIALPPSPVIIKYHASLYTEVGVMITEWEFEAGEGSNNVRFNLDGFDLSSGVYSLVLRSSRGVEAIKIMIQQH